MMYEILARSPINKTASIVVNQCGCSSRLELNSLLEQHEKLKEVMRHALNQRKSKARSELITDTNKQLSKISQKLSPYYQHHRKLSCKSREQALLTVIDYYLPKQVSNFIKNEAETILGL